MSTTPLPTAGRHPLALITAVCAFIASFGNWPLWQALWRLPDLSGPRGLLFGVAFALMIASVLTLLAALLGWGRALKPVLIVMLVSAAAGAHFMGTYGIVIDAGMMTNVAQTDPREVRDLLSLRLVVGLALLGLLPAWWVWRQTVTPLGWRGRIRVQLAAVFGALALAIFCLWLVFADLSATMRNHKSLRYLINPLNSFYALGRVAVEAQRQPSGPPLPIGTDARLAPRAGKPPLLLLVVGETARAANFSLNGYKRDTNPELARRGVLSWRQVRSCGTNTAASLPCMFSHLGRRAYLERSHDSETLLDVAQRAGLAVLWLDNQVGCKGVCQRVPNSHASLAAPGAPPLPPGLCKGEECFDEALLHGLDQRLAAMPAEARARGVLLVFHMLGSHGPAYHLRTPATRKPFGPECTTAALQQCERETVVNAYDNTIAYTDFVLGRSIDWLQTQTGTFEPSLLYLSDHGESLGENHVYLHGLPYALAPAEQTHVPMIAWWPRNSAAAIQAWDCAAATLDQSYSHDQLFHTVLGQLGVLTEVYDAGRDLFAPCRRG